VTLCALLAWSGEAIAQKTDVITLDNGDHITCEIKEMERGRLRCKTDVMGTLYIEWEHIVDIDTDKTLEVEMESGQRYFGSIQPAVAPAEMQVAIGQASTTIRRREVAFVKEIDPSFWGKLDGGIDFGASFTQADNQLDYSLNANAAYTGRTNQVTVTLNSLLKLRDNSPTTNRQVLGIQWQRPLRWPRWFGMVVGNFEHNDELDLDLRALGGYGVGRYLAQTNRWTWSAYGIGAYSREQFRGNEEASADLGEGSNNLEAGLGTDIQVFTFGEHDTDISTRFVFMPSITSPGRFRLRLNTKVKREFLTDLYFALDLFETYDSDPPQAGGAKNNDLGFTMSLGWSY
jgi:hypothetical protein